MRRRTFLGLMVLAGCAFQENIGKESGFSESAYCFLVEEFTKKGLYNLDSPLFDFNDKEVRAAYEKTKNANGTIERDRIGKEFIERAVKNHLKKYNKSLILISGAGFHIYGVVRNLRKQGVGYISITPKKLDFYDVIQENRVFEIQNPEQEVREARETLEGQLERANGVVRYYGYRDLKDFVEKSSEIREARNIAVGIEETGMHERYKGHMGKVYDAIETFIQRFKPSSILYLRENMYFYEELLREKFENKTRELRIPVIFERF